LGTSPFFIGGTHLPTKRKQTFDQWIKQEGLDEGRPEVVYLDPKVFLDILWRTWQASAAQYEDMDRRESEREAAISRGYTKKIESLHREIARYTLHVAIRKEVHRDDFLRSADQMAALKMIVRMSEPGSPIYEIANEAIINTWGIDATTKHCDQHFSYRSTCPDCKKAGLSKARGHDVKYGNSDTNSDQDSPPAAGL
jgi:hypothetical protein